MNPSPAAGVVLAHVAAQFAIPGAWSHDAASDVPVFVSAPAAEMKKQLVIPEGTPAGHGPPAAKALAPMVNPVTNRKMEVPISRRTGVPCP